MKALIILLLLSIPSIAGIPPYFTTRPASSTEILDKIPLRFERSSPGEQGDYIARGPGFVLRISSTGSRLEWTNSSERKTADVRTRLAGANSNCRLEPLKPLAGIANYFIGDQAHWRTDVQAWEGVRCRAAYPGIDLVFHGSPSMLEYDFEVQPHADPRRIRMKLTGQQKLAIDGQGDLVVSTIAGEIRWKHPDVYQMVDGARERVAGRFVLAGSGTVRFETGPYDERRDLIIDPALAYSTYLGGNGNDTARAVAVDAQGNVYICGQTSSTNLPVVSAFQATHAPQPVSGLSDAFVAKFNPYGTLLYLTYLGGSNDDVGMAIAVDAAGNAYVTGYTTSADFPIAGRSPFQSQFGGSGGQNWFHLGDAFITKVNPSGNALVYSTYFGGSGDDAAAAIVVDSAGDAYIAGGSASTNFPATPGAYQPLQKGAGGEPIEPCCGGPFIDPGDAFVAELDPTGSKLLLATLAGGYNDDFATSLALDAAGNIYIAGYTMSPNFPTTTGALQRFFAGFDQQTSYFVTGDAFITKLNASATALQYSTYFGGTGDECITSIAVDSTGAVYFTGWSSTLNLPTTPGAIQSAYAGYVALPFNVEYRFGDAVVGKLNPAGSQLSYLTYLGGNANDAGLALAVDGAGNAFVAGFTDSTNFPVTGNAMQPTFAGDGGPTPPYLTFGDAFLAMVNPSGTGLLYSTFFGGARDDEFYGLALDGTGKVYAVGNSYSRNWNVTANAFQSIYAGQLNVTEWPYGDAVYSVFSFSSASPVVTRVLNAEGGAATIAPNTWTQINGSNLAPDTRTWQGSDFVNKQMPTQLDGASVTLNGEKAFVYYISPVQIDILTPPDLAAGPVQVVVSNQGAQSSAFTATAEQYSTSFFVFNGGPYVVATHADNALIGPTSLYPGFTTPAAPGEIILLYANGFGPVTPPVVSGSEAQSGTLPSLPEVRIGNESAMVKFAGLISPGLYQFNVVVPAGAAAGDNAITATFSGSSTQAGTLLTVK